MRKILKFFSLVLMTSFLIMNFGSCSNGSDSSSNNNEDTIYKDFYNYPTGRENSSGTLTISNPLTNDKLLVFDSSVEGKNYIGTIPAGSTIKVKLESEKFHVIVGVKKAEYDEKQENAPQSSSLTYYRDTQAYKISVSAENLTGGGRLYFNNKTNYWVSVESVDNTQTYAVIQPNAQRVAITCQLNETYDYKIVYHPEIKVGGQIVAIPDNVTDMAQNDSIMLTSSNNNIEVSITNPTQKLASTILPSVYITNNSGKGIRVKNGCIPLNSATNSSDDFVLNNGASVMFTDFTVDSLTTAINISCTAWTKDYSCDTSFSMQKGKVYRIVVTGTNSAASKEPPIFAVTEANIEDYVDEN